MLAIARPPLALTYIGEPSARPSSPPVMQLLVRQESVRRASFWDCATQNALRWSQRWESNGPIIEMGSDLLGVAMQADEASGGTGDVLLRLASTCRCLRGLLLPRLLEKKDDAVRRLFLTGALA